MNKQENKEYYKKHRKEILRRQKLNRDFHRNSEELPQKTKDIFELELNIENEPETDFAKNLKILIFLLGLLLIFNLPFILKYFGRYLL